jgi:sRNA-binding carbon storage regulator CsrA
MVVVSRAVGEAVVIGDLKVVAVENIERDFVEICITERASGLTPPVSLTLRKNQSMEIMPDVHVALIDVRTTRPRARLGFVLPLDVPIHRKEVLDSSQGS